MAEAMHQDRVQPQDSPSRPFVLINSFTPKPGKIDDLANLLEAARDRFADRVQGFHGGRVYRDVDGNSALLISVFESEDDYERWISTAMFAEYQKQIADITDGMGQSRIEAGRAPRPDGRKSMHMGSATA